MQANTSKGSNRSIYIYIVFGFELLKRKILLCVLENESVSLGAYICISTASGVPQLFTLNRRTRATRDYALPILF